MCVGDWRVGRFIRCSFSTVAVTAGTPVFIAASQQRVGIRISEDAATVVSGAVFDLKSEGVPVKVMYQGLEEMYLSVEHDGDLPMHRLELNTALGGPFTLGITEMFLPEEFLQKGTEQWQKELMR